MNLTHRFKPKRGSLFCSPLTLFLVLAGGAAVQAGPLINFIPPVTGPSAQNGTFNATLRLTGSADPSTIKITSGNQDVTGMFNVGSCAQAPCTVYAVLTPGNGVTAGENFLTATIRGANSSVDTAQLRFFNSNGLSDPTVGVAPPHTVRIQQFGAEVDILTPIPIKLPSCGALQFQVADLNRSTLQVIKSQCMNDTDIGPYLKTLDESDLVIVNTVATVQTGKADFSAIGGINVVAAGAA